MYAEDIFKKHNKDYLKFKRVESKKTNRPDLHAFLLLDELFPDNKDIVSAASHDELWLSIESEDIEKLTEDQILELTRCGIRYDEDSLCMFA